MVQLKHNQNEKSSYFSDVARNLSCRVLIHKNLDANIRQK